jgi:hypothetical protein
LSLLEDVNKSRTSAVVSFQEIKFNPLSHKNQNNLLCVESVVDDNDDDKDNDNPCGGE